MIIDLAEMKSLEIGKIKKLLINNLKSWRGKKSLGSIENNNWNNRN